MNIIFQDVEANTVRLKEHDQDVLILEKIPAGNRAMDQGNSQPPQHKYVFIWLSQCKTMINFFKRYYYLNNSMFFLSVGDALCHI